MTKPNNVLVLSLDDARQIIASFGVSVPESTMLLASAILRQQRILLVQIPLYEYAQVVAGTKRLTLEAK